MCGGCGMSRPAQQLGIPLDDITLDSMDKKEHAFWIDFLEEAQKVLSELRRSGQAEPYTPPASLAKKFHKAVNKYDGAKYCQIRQLREIFSF